MHTYLVYMCAYIGIQEGLYGIFWTMEKTICTMAWETEVTFYREIEGTENLTSYLPSKQNQTYQYSVFFMPVLQEAQALFL